MRAQLITSALVLTLTQGALAGTDTFFNPLTQSAVVSAPNSSVEANSPWLVPAGVAQSELTAMDKIEADAAQSVVRVPGLGRNQSMFDMLAFDESGENIFIPHETASGAGVTRYNVEGDKAETLFSGDQNGASGDWSNDYGAFDPATFTPNGTLLLGEEWSGEGRIIEVLNPHEPVADIQIRELESIANVSHEGLRFSADGGTLYFVDEYNSGSLYKFVMTTPGDYTAGQTFVLKVNAFDGFSADMWNDPSNAGKTRTGAAHWAALTDENGTPLTTISPFLNGPPGDPRTESGVRGGRPAADEVGATPYGRPEDMEVGRLTNGNEVLYFTATSERAVYSIEVKPGNRAVVRVFASDATTPKNEGYPATSAEMNSPDNLAQDALGNIYVIEDAPNGSPTGGDIWFVRDVDGDGVGESLDHFLSLQVAGSEATGMIFNPVNPTEFVVSVQHPSSTDLGEVADGQGDAIWKFSLNETVAPPCKYTARIHPWGKSKSRRRNQLKTCNNVTSTFVSQLEKKRNRHWGGIHHH